MNRMQIWLARASAELGVRVETSYRVSLPARRELTAQAYFPDLGTSRGMLVFLSFDELADVEDELSELGFGVSVFDEPLPNEEYDVSNYEEMFADWGWTGDVARRPTWMSR